MLRTKSSIADSALILARTAKNERENKRDETAT